GPAWTDLARAACHPVAPAVLGAVEDVEIDLSLDAMRQAGAGILPEQPLAARIDLRRVLCDRTQPEGIVLEGADQVVLVEVRRRVDDRALSVVALQPVHEDLHLFLHASARQAHLAR